ncbi:MAG: DUF72 domain-containing protein [Dehalococcoidia bacterium]|nr:DUF72 domain-containing protein [Dehalococcoidia bacterium]
MANYLVGTSGWHYPHWQGKFYPPDLPKQQWLAFYAQTFSTVELNNTFYRQPLEKTVKSWRDAVPAGFKYAVKASRYITHIKRLKEVAEPVEKFFDRVRLLDNRLGPLLYQLPPGLKRDDVRLDEFLSLLPADLEHTIEFRHKSWLDDAVYRLLHRRNVALCIFDLPRLRTPAIVTADFAYVRFHGNRVLYGGCYSDEELDGWAREIRGLRAGKVYAYFNNDADGFAVDNALTLKRLLET